MRFFSVATVIVIAAILLARNSTAQIDSSIVTIDADDIGGLVVSKGGAEAGVWVIAETRDLPTGFRKIVVTDESGYYLIPDLPLASYDIWVRGYGLIDSPKIEAEPGDIVNLTAVEAPTAQEAAQYYPSSSW